LDQPPDLRRVFGWVARCTRHLLALMGEFTPDLQEQLTLLESYVADSAELATIRDTLERLWVQRSPHETAKAAVVQLFGALIRYRQGDEYRHLGCTVSITMLVDAAPHPRQALAVVLDDFAYYLR
jgi:hypothetical protein